ncbi:MAG: radical SAM protein, partial [Candidatus Methylomirabilis sp.]|nr:radical SAM protein [Deltaproteobacteria bacterium]
ALAWPDYSLIDPARYSESFFKGAIAPILTSRGCPHACTYCVRTYGKEVVYRSPESVLGEIEAALAHGIRRIRFMDDTFALNRRRCATILESILERGLGIEWSALTRVDGLDADLLALMRRSGCRRLYLGVESGSQRMLDAYKKGMTLDQARRAAGLVKAAGIEASGFFIVGAPEETEEDLAASIAFAKELDLDYVIVTRLQYWPGTDLFPEMAGRVRFSLVPTRVEVPGVRAYEAYYDWERRFYREFYLRPRYVARRARSLLRTPGDVLSGFRSLLAYSFAKEARDFI